MYLVTFPPLVTLKMCFCAVPSVVILTNIFLLRLQHNDSNEVMNESVIKVYSMFTIY